MATYAIGDVQGCMRALDALLERIAFDATRDRLWFTGDLVNRGPDSLAVLRFVMGLGGRAVTVLGNHDLHLLAVAAKVRAPRPQDSLAEVLRSPERESLLAWLRQRPLLHHDERLGFTLIHAGLLPSWDLALARTLAREVETLLRGPDHRELLRHMYGDTPAHWEPTLGGWERLRVTINAFTRLRYCDRAGHMALGPVGPPGSQPPGLIPWFQAPGRRSRELRVLFGHWSALGAWQGEGVIALDSGCCWNRALTAAQLDVWPPKFIQVPCGAPRHATAKMGGDAHKP